MLQMYNFYILSAAAYTKKNYAKVCVVFNRILFNDMLFF